MAQPELQRKVYENPVPASKYKILEGVTCSLVIKEGPVPREITPQELANGLDYLIKSGSTNDEIRLFKILSSTSLKTAVTTADIQIVFGDSTKIKQDFTKPIRTLRIKLDKEQSLDLDIKNVSQAGRMGRYYLGRKSEDKACIEEVFVAPDGERLYPVAALSDKTGIYKDDLLDSLKRKLKEDIEFVRISSSERRLFTREKYYNRAIAALTNDDSTESIDPMEEVYDERDCPQTQETNNDFTDERWGYLKDHLTVTILSILNAGVLSTLEPKKVKKTLQACLPIEKGISNMLENYEKKGQLNKLLIEAFVEKINEIQRITDENCPWKTVEERKAAELLAYLKRKRRTVPQIVGAVCQHFGEKIPKKYKTQDRDEDFVSLFVER